jgi:tRNA(adenine34) deaminase
MSKLDEQYMREALKEAERALTVREKPVGAVVVYKAHIVGRAHHQTKTLRDPTAHAAIIAITQAANALQADQLSTTALYVTQEPCCMCVGAVLLAGVSRMVFGVEDPRQGACGSVIDIPANERLNRRLTVIKGVMTTECSSLLRKAVAGTRLSG